jgi:hypothetical protein
MKSSAAVIARLSLATLLAGSTIPSDTGYAQTSQTPNRPKGMCVTKDSFITYTCLQRWVKACRTYRVSASTCEMKTVCWQESWSYRERCLGIVTKPKNRV